MHDRERLWIILEPLFPQQLHKHPQWSLGRRLRRLRIVSNLIQSSLNRYILQSNKLGTLEILPSQISDKD
jgi:hypothetical protein